MVKFEYERKRNVAISNKMRTSNLKLHSVPNIYIKLNLT